jgi:hypothetical protein
MAADGLFESRSGRRTDRPRHLSTRCVLEPDHPMVAGRDLVRKSPGEESAADVYEGSSVLILQLSAQARSSYFTWLRP